MQWAPILCTNRIRIAAGDSRDGTEPLKPAEFAWLLDRRNHRKSASVLIPGYVLRKAIVVMQPWKQRQRDGRCSELAISETDAS